MVSVSDGSVIRKRKKKYARNRLERKLQSVMRFLARTDSKSKHDGDEAEGEHYFSLRSWRIRCLRMCLPQPIIEDYPFIYTVPVSYASSPKSPSASLREAVFAHLTATTSSESRTTPLTQAVGTSDALKSIPLPVLNFNSTQSGSYLLFCHEIIELTRLIGGALGT
jgi:hypothetical protein